MNGAPVPRNEIFTVFYLVPRERVQAVVPQPLKVLEVLPGLTVGGYYAASYRTEGGATRRELALISGICECQDKRGFYLRELAREAACYGHGAPALPAFQWEVDNMRHVISLHEGDRVIFHLRVTPRIPLFPIRMGFPFLSLKGNGLPFLRVFHTNQVSLSTSRVTVPSGSRFLPYPMRLKIASFHWVASNVVIEDVVSGIEPHILRDLEGAFGKNPVTTCLPAGRARSVG